jgi:formylglycine-generating enzyme required for sulfatase activity
MPPDLLPEMTLIPGGDFLMGSDDGEDDERPAHRVYVDDVHIGVTPVTNEQYARFVRETGYRSPAIYELPLVVSSGGRDRERLFRQSAAPYVWSDLEPPAARGNHPVTLIRWEDATAYCAWLANVTGRPIRLPTEAEWEKASRGGIEGRRYPWGDRLDRDYANFLTDPTLKTAHGTVPARSYPPNGYGLFDMIGNVWEWVGDWFQPDYYSVSPVRNPRGPESGHLRIIRGGGWLVADVRMLSCSHRHKVPPDTYSYSIGFRIAYSTAT